MTFSHKHSLSFRLLASVINVCFILNFLSPARALAQSPSDLGLPKPGSLVNLTPAYVPVLVKGLHVHPENPVLFDFIVDTGNSGFTPQDQNLKAESEKLIKYFLASLTIPEDDIWVNLSPYEKNRIVPEQLGQTEMGRDMLAEDYILKQLTASLIYPERSLGKEFWSKVYAKAQQLYGSTEIPVNTFNKVWILPDQAGVYVRNNTAYVVEEHLKVMLEEDYLSLDKHSGIQGTSVQTEQKTNSLGNQIVREVVLPELEKEINTGKNFATLRQMFYSMILATWYKKNLKEALLNQVYSNKAKINGVDLQDKTIKEQIYQEYLKAYKKGVFNYIKEDIDQTTKQSIPRKYFSGGLGFSSAKSSLRNVKVYTDDSAVVRRALGNGPDGAMVSITARMDNSAGRITDEFFSNLDKSISDDGGEIRFDRAMVTPIQVARGVQYWGGTSTTSIARPFRASQEADVKDITTLDSKEALRLERLAAESLLRGEGSISMMVAGASSRMNVKQAPDQVRSMADENIQSKAGVPIGIVDGKAVTYLDAFGINFSRLIGQISEQASKAGVTTEGLAKNDVLLMSNNEYRDEHERIIATHGHYGLSPDQIRLFNQPLEPIYWATHADVEKLKANGKFKTDADYQAALAKANEVKAKLEAGDQQAVIVGSQRDPLGHGEFLHQLVVSGELLHMFETGKKWFFVKNVDNYAAKFDQVWLRILGRFLDQHIDFQPEVSPRAPGQSGGSLIVMEDNGSQQLAEDPTLKATLGPDGKPKVNPTDSFWFNDAVAFGRPEYVASLYFKPGQTLSQFIAEYKEAFETGNKDALQAIAERGRSKFPKLLDPKPAKNEAGATVKIETNMWQSTGVAATNMNIQSIGVRGARNFNINDYPTMSSEQQRTELANLRFLATKQWSVDPKVRAEAKEKLAKLLGREVTDAEVDLTLESFEGNRRIADDLINYILKGDLVSKGVFDNAMVADQAEDAYRTALESYNNAHQDVGTRNGNREVASALRQVGEARKRLAAALQTEIGFNLADVVDHLTAMAQQKLEGNILSLELSSIKKLTPSESAPFDAAMNASNKAENLLSQIEGLRLHQQDWGGTVTRKIYRDVLALKEKNNSLKVENVRLIGQMFWLMSYFIVEGDNGSMQPITTYDFSKFKDKNVLNAQMPATYMEFAAEFIEQDIFPTKTLKAVFSYFSQEDIDYFTSRKEKQQIGKDIWDLKTPADRLLKALRDKGIIDENNKLVDAAMASSPLLSVLSRAYLSSTNVNVANAITELRQGRTTAAVAEIEMALPRLDLADRSAIQSVLRERGLLDAAMGVRTLPLIPTENIRPVKFGTSGDRWVEQTWQDQQIDSADHLNRIGTGVAQFFNQNTPGKIMLIGFDPRQRNPESAKALASLYVANGIKVKIINTESTPTPVLALMANRDENIGGVTILTASHSPWTDRGIKFSPYHGGAAPTAMTNQIQALANQAIDYKTADYEKAKQEGTIVEVSPEEAQKIYVDEYVVPQLKKLGAWTDMVTFIQQNPNFEVVLDPMQGTGVRYLKAIYESLSQAAGRNFYTMINTNNNDIHFSNVNGEPNPTLRKSRAAFEAAVQQKIGEGKQVMGASVDTDSDRFGNIDSNGEFVSTNDMIALIAYFLKKEIRLEGAIGKTVATSNFANAIAKYLGAEIDEEPVGFKYFVDNVISKGRKYLIAGEESSHVAVGPFMESWDDGFVVGLMGLWITAKTGKSLTQYKDLIQKTLDQKFVIETITLRGKDDSVKDGINAKIAQTQQELTEGKTLSDLAIVKEVESLQSQKVVDVITKDGVKLVLESGDWVLMRPSGTEPAVKLYVEVAGKYESSSTEMKRKFDQLVAVGRKVIGVDSAMNTKPVPEIMAVSRALRSKEFLGQNEVSVGKIIEWLSKERDGVSVSISRGEVSAALQNMGWFLIDQKNGMWTQDSALFANRISDLSGIQNGSPSDASMLGLVDNEILKHIKANGFLSTMDAYTDKTRLELTKQKDVLRVLKQLSDAPSVIYLKDGRTIEAKQAETLVARLSTTATILATYVKGKKTQLLLYFDEEEGTKVPRPNPQSPPALKAQAKAPAPSTQRKPVLVGPDGTIPLKEEDSAMKNASDLGGIDFNAKNLKMGVKGDQINIKFDPAMIEQFKRGDFSGVRPVIINITPLNSIWPVLGLSPVRKEEERLASI
jgi:phosphomannomutase